jgi:hypothetical protein
MSAPSAAAPAPSAAAQTFTNNGAFNVNNIVNNNGNNIVNNNVTIVKIPKITNDGKVYLPDKFVPLENEINDEGKKSQRHHIYIFYPTLLLNRINTQRIAARSHPKNLGMICGV